jgi:hypothetical protein
MSASEWIAVPGAAGAAVLRTTDVRQKALDLEFERHRRMGATDLENVDRQRSWPRNGRR